MRTRMMSNININNKKDYLALSTIEKNKLAVQYEPLVNKITKQFQEKTHMEWNAIKSMAYEGLVLAFNTYDNKKSNMKFLNYAAFAIRNNILTSIDNELRTVKLSNYAQKRSKEKGESLFNTVSLDSVVGKERRVDTGAHQVAEFKRGCYESDKFSNGDVYEYLYKRLGDEFCEKDLDIFYRSFGLKDYDVEKGKDLAKKFGCSEGLISQKNKKIITYIQGDNDLREMLGSLLTN